MSAPPAFGQARVEATTLEAVGYYAKTQYLHGSQDAGFPLRRLEFLSLNVKKRLCCLIVRTYIEFVVL